MNIKLVIKVISILLLIVSGFMLVPCFVAYYYNETNEIFAFLKPIIFTSTLSFLVLFMLRKEKKNNLSTRDGFMLVTFSWILASLLGSVPFVISGAIPDFASAYFETMSGFTTTGASILSNIESTAKSMLFWRSLTHWLGGMGIVVLTVAILPLLGIGGLQLIKAEAPGPTVDKITPRITETAKYLWYIYLFFTIVETLLLMLGGMNLFDALTHTFGTLATGGFSPKNASVGHYQSMYLHSVITVFMVLAGINFILHFKFLTGRIRQVFSDTELKLYLLIFAVATAIITFSIYTNNIYSFKESINHAAFQTASILTTTGYATADFEQWPVLAKTVLFILMFIGGCSGSTGGGIKVIRIATLLKQGINEMKYLVHPRGVFSLKISGNSVKKNIVYAISGFFFLYLLMLLITTFVVATGGSDIITSFTTALATVGNIGPGFGDIGPAENYAFFKPYIKWFLSFAMLVGRLELYTVLVLFTPAFWQK
jgi:trk system potassium uptake protein TrkH